MPYLPSADDIQDAVDRGIRTGLRAALAPLAAEVDSIRRLSRPVLTVQEVADMLDCTPDRVKRFHVRKQGLQAYRPGKSPVFLPDDVEAYVRRFPEGAWAGRSPSR
ncbi:MAG TPA: helix-turn-helix domain-containing protein [Rubricoccaceae bacterium]|jgi:hypothetical protein